MANAWQEVDWIAAESLMIMSDEMVITKLAARDKTSDFMVRPNGYTVGDTVRIKTRPDYTVEEFSSSIVIQDIRESTRSMQIEKHYDVSVQITAKEKALDLESFSEQVIAPAARRLAEQVDIYTGTKILQGAGAYISDTLFTTAADVALGRKASNYQQLDPGGRFCLVDDTLEATLLGQTWFNQSQTRGGPGVSTLQTGNMGRVMGMDFAGSLNFPTTTAATVGTAICVTNNTSGTKNLIGDTSLIVDTQTASKTLVVGDRLQIAGVRRPVVVKTAVADTTSTTEIELTNPITEIIPDNAAVTVIGSGQDVAYHGAIFDGRALGVAMPLLDMPSDKPASVITDNGISIRVVQGYDMASKKETLSLDLLIGAIAYDHRRITLLGEY